jgi:hypothetical protein
MPRRPDPGSVAAARRLIADLRIRAAKEIDVDLIAAHHGILVRRSPLGHEEGRLLRAGSTGIINVEEGAYASNKWRFVIAHEIGHFLRHPSSDDFQACTKGDLSSYTGSGRETEANDFASELLMPQTLFEKKCDRNRPCLKDVGDLAGEFRTSLTSTALRFVMFAPEPCAVVHSTDGRVDWLDWSDNFRLGIRKKTKLSDRTYAGDLFAGRNVDDRPSQVDGDAWSDSGWADQIDLFEHSRRVSPNSVLSFLWHGA